MTRNLIVRIDNTLLFKGGRVRDLTPSERLLLWLAKRCGALVNLPEEPR